MHMTNAGTNRQEKPMKLSGFLIQPAATVASMALLAGCASQSASVADTAQAISYQCGQRSLVVTTTGERLRLFSQGDAHDLEAVVAASGARYQGVDDNRTEFWSKGDSARVTLAGQPLPECVRAGALPASLVARGNEPFWSVQLESDRMTLRTPDGEQSVAAQVESASDGGWLVTAPDEGLSLALHPELCQDSMADMMYPMSASLIQDGQAYPGCAGEPGLLLQGIDWRVTHLEGAATGAGHSVTLAFDPEGRIYGQAPCNRYFGSYTLTGEGLSIGALGSTLMACQEDAMARERRLMNLLPDVRAFRVSEAPLTLELLGTEGVLLRAKPAAAGH